MSDKGNENTDKKGHLCLRQYGKDIHVSHKGPDNISPRILKELATDISPLLQLIFQKSLDTGVVPDDWRIANVSHVYKKGQKSLAENTDQYP